MRDEISELPAAVVDGTAADAPVVPQKRGPGRPKGLPKTGGRQKGMRNWSDAEVRAELIDKSNLLDVLCDIVAGRPLMCGPDGSTGKAGPRVASMRIRSQTALALLAKFLPDRQSSEVTGKDGAALIPGTVDPDPKTLARAVYEMLGRADVPPAVAAGPLHDPVPAWQYAGTPPDSPSETGPAPAAPAPAPEPDVEVGTRIRVGHGEIVRIEVQSTGAKKWAVVDARGELHGMRVRRADAEAHAASLPMPGAARPIEVSSTSKAQTAEEREQERITRQHMTSIERGEPTGPRILRSRGDA